MNVQYIEAVQCISAVLSVELPIMPQNSHKLAHRFWQHLQAFEYFPLPDNSNDFVKVAALRLREFDWESAFTLIAEALKSCKPNRSLEKLFPALRDAVKVAALQNYVVCCSFEHCEVELSRLAGMFVLTERKVHSVVSKMLYDHAMGSWDASSRIVLFKEMPLQAAVHSCQLTSMVDKLAQQLDNLAVRNEQRALQRSSVHRHNTRKVTGLPQHELGCSRKAPSLTPTQLDAVAGSPVNVAMTAYQLHGKPKNTRSISASDVPSLQGRPRATTDAVHDEKEFREGSKTHLAQCDVVRLENATTDMLLHPGDYANDWINCYEQCLSAGHGNFGDCSADSHGTPQMMFFIQPCPVIYMMPVLVPFTYEGSCPWTTEADAVAAILPISSWRYSRKVFAMVGGRVPFAESLRI
jgi:hypothetical protein